MEYDFVRMGPDRFEDMAVALCSAHFGPGGQTFGKGADGGREWTYSGRLPMPQISLEEKLPELWSGGDWGGYTVIQAKHKEILEGGEKDINWLITTIQKEVNAWKSDDKDRKPKPTNLLIITNVKLSGVQDKGGIDRLTVAMRKHEISLGLQGWGIWHSTHITRLIDNHIQIRQTYLGLIVTGDILAVLLEDLGGGPIDALTCLTGFIAKELVAEAQLRATRSGSALGKELLADVGIDLPAIDRSDAEDEAGKQKIIRVSQTIIENANSPKNMLSKHFCNVLIGGPGQGKSTIGQLICQAYRAAILKDRMDKLPLEQKGILNNTLRHCESIGLDLPTMLRWPIYIKLNEYSEYILGSEDYSILKYITKKINDRGGPYDLKKNNLFNWLKRWPWLVVLDGLDEVPDTSTRNSLLQKISEFVADAAAQDADVHIIATTRPQGYQEDLGGLFPREYDLIQLDKKEALAYGRKLVESRHPSDAIEAKEIIDRLTAASAEQLTARLMGTPLQVSIMSSLLEDSIRLPSTRHALFNEFYETVYRREKNKVGSVGKRVDHHKNNIDSLHDDAGVRLHIESERAGQAGAFLQKSDLKNLVRDHLLNVQAYEQVEAESAAGDVVDLATDRLVLLVENSANSWGFEVRSFQEFMASRALVTGTDEAVLARMKLLVRSTHWRNAWKFAAAQIFDQRTHLREKLMEIITNSDSDSLSHYITKPSALLCCELLEDNFAFDAPGFRRRLIHSSIELLDNPQFPSSLIPIINAETARNSAIRMKVQERLEECLNNSGWRKFAAENTMRYWLRYENGGVSSFIRVRLARKEVRFEIAESDTSISIEEILRQNILLDDLNVVDQGIVLLFLEAVSKIYFLDAISAPGIEKPYAQSFPYTDLSHAFDSLLASDAATQAILDSFIPLSELHLHVAVWFIAELAQHIGQIPTSGALDLATT